MDTGDAKGKEREGGNRWEKIESQGGAEIESEIRE